MIPMSQLVSRLAPPLLLFNTSWGQGCTKWGAAQARFSTCCRLQPTFTAVMGLEAICVIAAATYTVIVIVAATRRTHRSHTGLVRVGGWCALACLLFNLAALAAFATSACFHTGQWTFAGATESTAWHFGAGPFLCVISAGLDAVAGLFLMTWRVIPKVSCCGCDPHTPVAAWGGSVWAPP
jgi:hypothetical protein